MARAVNRLTARQVAALKEPGNHADGSGLYLRVVGTRRSWIFVYQWQGKRREMGLGSTSDVSLAEARAARDRARQMVLQGIDPIAQRRAEATPAKVTPKFGAFADQLIDDLSSGWRNEKHVAQWKMTLGDAYCSSIRSKPIDEIMTGDIIAILKPVWISRAETASRLRGRLEKVLDAAKARGHRTGENPARWRGHLDLLLPKRRKLQRGHHRAMSWRDVPQFYERLSSHDAMAARALQFLILTASRTGETLGAQWSEFDFDAAVWIVPAARMKAGREHRVPLSSAALAVVKELHSRCDPENPYVFAGFKRGRPLSSMSMEMLLRRMKVTGVTVHGFRSSYRDWADEQTDFSFEVIEQSLAHTVGNAVTRAYRRTDVLERRRALAQAWADFVTGVSDGD